MEDQKILTGEKLPVNLCRLSNFVLRFQLEIVDSRRLQVKMGQKGKAVVANQTRKRKNYRQLEVRESQVEILRVKSEHPRVG